MSGKEPKNYLQFIWLVLFAFAVASCSQKPTIKVGFSAELSGKQSELGVQLRNGVEMAVLEVNNAGGIHGRSIDLLIEDDLGTPEGAADAEKKLFERGAQVVIGHMTSGQTVAGYAEAEKNGVLLLSATASTSEMTGKKDLFFRTVASTDAMGQSFAKFIFSKSGFSQSAIIYDRDNNSFTEPMSRAFTEAFTSMGGKVVKEVIFSEKTDPDFSPLVNQLKISDPDSVLIIASPGSTALIAQNIELLKWEIPLFSSSWAQSDTLIQNGGKTVEGIKFIFGFDVNDPSPALQDFKIKYLNKFSISPIFTAMEGYETMRMLAAALEITGGETEGLPHTLTTMRDFKGLTGPIQMDEYGDAVRHLYILEVHQGKFVTIEKFNSTQ